MDGLRMAYHIEGNGDPIIFLHGNPTSSFIWRKIIPYVNDKGCCLAPDLMGMGYSDKVPETVRERYSYAFHYKKIAAFIDHLTKPEQKVILVAHDWGAVLAIHWARLHPDRIKGIAFMETFLEPLETGKSPQFAIDWFKNWRTENMAKAVLDSNRFVEQVLLGEVSQFLTEEEKMEYRKPFLKPGEDRLPTLIWPRQVSVDTDPMDTHEVLIENMRFMSSTRFPKLFVNAQPGALLAPEARKRVIRQWPNLEEVVVAGRHFVQESSPDSIGLYLSKWIAKHQ